MRTLNLSHLVIAAADVPRMTRFFEAVFAVPAHYKNEEFADFVLPGGARVAFFLPVGKSAHYFDAATGRGSAAFGVAVEDVQGFYEHARARADEFELTFSGPPKEHPWGEPSFLLIDPEGNRWEITASPNESGTLPNR